MDLAPTDNPRLTARFERALVYAFQLHRRQTRKGSHTPYIAHLLAVTSLVIEDGGDEDQAIAALLHDAVEDQGGLVTLERIRTKFGDRVARIVEGCTDADSLPKPPWRSRKEAYLNHLAGAPAEVRRVSLADKLHNARSILADLRQSGDSVWKRFNGGKDGTLWYYRSLVEIFRAEVDRRMVIDLGEVVDKIERLCA
jgi:(p)ppGpp synthase/HD superfamily hydrolase